MRNEYRLAKVTILLMCAGCCLMGCAKQPEQPDRNWDPPVTVGSSLAGLGGAPWLYKHQDALIGVQVLHDGEGNLYSWNRANGSWSTTNIPSLDASGWLHLWGAAAIDPQSGRVLLPGGYAENEQLVMKVFLGTISRSGGLGGVTERYWVTDSKSLLGETGPNVTLNRPPVQTDHPNREGARLGTALVNGSEIYVPFSVDAFAYLETPVRYQGKTHYRKAFERGPFANGVFHSADSGRTWELEKISDLRCSVPALCRTTSYIHFFAGSYPLWHSRKSVESRVWERPQAVTKTSTGVNGMFDVAGDGETAHICWMDRRHNKTRFNLTGPPIENNDIYYRRRKDSDSEWSKEVWLSKGLLYCYAPTIATEGDNVVVAWAGIRDAGKRHTDMGPNDIYFVTSKDGGQTWTKPLKVTDGARDGLTAGMPQVALLNGTIHLLYVQGKLPDAKELSPGLTRMGGEPWPIYHTYRPFPK